MYTLDSTHAHAHKQNRGSPHLFKEQAQRALRLSVELAQAVGALAGKEGDRHGGVLGTSACGVRAGQGQSECATFSSLS